ncbi:MAG: PHP domain-containing protein [Gemmatimonadota bacterium]|nr:PHP domain-containing protein [Gemmatimonadota bacterium]
MHSTASDGAHSPTEVVERSAAAGLAAISLTDHDSLDGVPEAILAGERLGVRVVAGCEFSVQATWGEMHLLGYFLPLDWLELDEFLVRTRADRSRRGAEMVDKLRALGHDLTLEDVLQESAGGAIGRPHVARALVRKGIATGQQDAFDRFIGWGRPGHVGKQLPAFKDVAALVHRGGGLVSAAHLRDRGSRSVLAALKAEGLDAVETRHPVHDPNTCGRLTAFAQALGLLTTGGSDWHGDEGVHHPGGSLGGQHIPYDWLDRLERARPVGNSGAA